MKFPTIKQLRYFIALVEHNHFGNAALSCFVSQSAFSVAIKELEKTLGGKLVDRTNKSVTVTNLGREAYEQAKLVMKETSKLVDISQRNNRPLSGKLSLGIIPSIAPFILSKFIVDLQSDNLELELFLNEDITKNLYSKLMSGDLDVLLIALPFALKKVKVLSLFKDDFYLTYLKGSKFVRVKNNTIKLNDESVLLLEDGHCMRDHALEACKLKDFNKVSQYSASSFLTLIEMVKNDIGITYLPKMSIDSYLVKDSNLVIKKLNNNSFREIGLVWREGSSRSEEFRLLGEYISQCHK